MILINIKRILNLLFIIFPFSLIFLRNYLGIDPSMYWVGAWLVALLTYLFLLYAPKKPQLEDSILTTETKVSYQKDRNFLKKLIIMYLPASLLLPLLFVVLCHFYASDGNLVFMAWIYFAGFTAIIGIIELFAISLLFFKFLEK